MKNGSKFGMIQTKLVLVGTMVLKNDVNSFEMALAIVTWKMLA